MRPAPSPGREFPSCVPRVRVERVEVRPLISRNRRRRPNPWRRTRDYPGSADSRHSTPPGTRCPRLTRERRGPAPRPRRTGRPHGSREGRSGSTRSSSASPRRSPSPSSSGASPAPQRLADVSGKSLTWAMTNTGWLFVLTSSGFVVFVLWLALSRFGNIPLGPRRRGTGVPDRVLDRDDVQRRHGHRPDVLRRRRAAHPLRHAAPGHRCRRATPRPRRPRWPPRCSTGPCTRGRSTPSSASPSPTASTARAASS